MAIGAGVVLPSANAAVTTGNRSVFVPIEPCRLFDTRPAPSNVGPRATPIGPGEAFMQQVTGSNGHCLDIPSDATAISMNVTAVDATAASYLTVYPADAAAAPQASNLNWTPGAPPTPNKVDVKLSATGAINLFNNLGTVNVLADVVGYYADHNHDDRYYTKAQIDASVNDTLRSEVYGRFEMLWEQPISVTTTTLNGCASNSTSNGVYGEIPIRLPVGSRLISVDVVVYDTPGTTSYAVYLTRDTLTATVYLGAVSGLGAGAGFVHTVITPAATEIAQEGAYYAVRVGSFQNSSNAFCELTATYDTRP